jgi:hypothetical protein
MNTTVTSLSPTTEGTGLRRWFKEAGRGVWRAMEVTGRARAQRHLLDFAYQCETLQPELAKELRAASRQSPWA